MLKDQGKFCVSNSMRNSFTTCRKKFYYKYIRQLRGKGYSSPLALGSMVHDGLEYYYTGQDWTKEDAAIRYVQAQKRSCPDWEVDEYSIDKFNADRWLAGTMVKAYREHYKEEDNAWEVLEVELEGRLTLKGEYHNTDMIFKADMLVRNVATGGYRLIEHKTTGQSVDTYAQTFDTDSQAISYWAAIESLIDHPIECITYNVLKKTQLRQGKKETYHDYITRIVDDYKINPKKYFSRHNIYITPKQITQWKDDFESITDDMRRCIAQDIFYRCTNSCNNWGKKCTYAVLCMEESEDMERTFLKQTTPWSEYGKVVGKE